MWASVDEMTVEQIDELLERFDQTAPPLARRIVAQFILNSANADERVAQLEEKISRARALLQSQAATVNPSLLVVRRVLEILR